MTTARHPKNTAYRVFDTWTGEYVGRVFGQFSRGRAERYANQLAWVHAAHVSSKGRFEVRTSEAA